MDGVGDDDGKGCAAGLQIDTTVDTAAEVNTWITTCQGACVRACVHICVLLASRPNHLALHLMHGLHGCSVGGNERHAVLTAV